MRAPEHELFYLNIRDKAQVDIKTLNYSITGEISFLSEDGPLNRKPYRFKNKLQLMGNSYHRNEEWKIVTLNIFQRETVSVRATATVRRAL